MLTADSVHMGGHPNGECRHVEALPLGFGSVSQAEEVFTREAHLLPITGKVSVHEVMRKHVVTGWHRRMGGKHGTLTDRFAGVRVRRSLLD